MVLDNTLHISDNTCLHIKKQKKMFTYTLNTNKIRDDPNKLCNSNKWTSRLLYRYSKYYSVKNE